MPPRRTAPAARPPMQPSAPSRARSIRWPKGRSDADSYAAAAARAMDLYPLRTIDPLRTAEEVQLCKQVAKIETTLRLAGLKAEREEIFRLARNDEFEGAIARHDQRALPQTTVFTSSIHLLIDFLADPTQGELRIGTTPALATYTSYRQSSSRCRNNTRASYFTWRRPTRPSSIASFRTAGSTLWSPGCGSAVPTMSRRSVCYSMISSIPCRRSSNRVRPH